MRRVAIALALLGAAALSAQGQVLPPSIQKPIDAARKAAGATNAQTRATDPVGADPRTAVLPAEAARAADQQKVAAADAALAAKPSAPGKAAAPARGDSAKGAAASQGGGKGTVTFYREEFAYTRQDRRDPFLSLMATGEVRPMLSDIAVIGLIYSAAPSRSVAVLIDGTTGETYRVKAGQTLGRMKVVKIDQRSVTLQVDEFGFSRQETLPLDRNPRSAGARSAPNRRAP